MDDLHSLNEAINAKAGRKLLPSILVSLAIFALVFVTIEYVPILFGVLVWAAIMLAMRELVRAYNAGGEGKCRVLINQIKLAQHGQRSISECISTPGNQN